MCVNLVALGYYRFLSSGGQDPKNLKWFFVIEKIYVTQIIYAKQRQEIQGILNHNSRLYITLQNYMYILKEGRIRNL